MARPDLDLDQDAVDPQDRAETSDETHLNEDADEFTTLEEAPNAYDATAADDDDEALAALDASEFDGDDDDDTDANDELDDTPDEFQREVEWAEASEESGDEAEASAEDALQGDEIEGLDEVRDADAVEGGEDDFTNFQSRNLSDEQLDELGYDGQRSGGTRATLTPSR
jgi:hypothetical protein